jgi:hypothetical protein
MVYTGYQRILLTWLGIAVVALDELTAVGQSPLGRR